MQNSFDCIHRLFEKQAARTPRNTAVIGADRAVSYEELNQRANALAHELLRRSVSAGDVVGLFADRSIEMVVGVLGILKSGAAYVPLDPDYPEERLALLVSDSSIPLLVTPERLKHLAPRVSGEVVGIPEHGEAFNPATRVTGEDLAYVIYTSGSTGVPKGVLVPHQGLTSLMTFTRSQMEIGERDRVLQFASFSFDASIWEIFAALVSGAALVLGDRDSLLPGPTLANLMKERGVTIALLSPSVLRMLDPDGLDHLRILIAGTEKLTSDIVRRWAPGRRFFNAYGPTETTIYSTILEVEDVSDEAPTIGTAVPHTEIYILDEELRPLPRGEAGELAIGGIGVGRGYLNREELTAQKFVTLAIEGLGPRRIYRTGDRARIREDGNIEYHGRTDFQVKVRGYRVELPEIEIAMEKHEAVGSAAVVDGKDAMGQTVLWAYYVPRSGHRVEPAELRSFLRERLPEYMVPSAFTELESWPLNPNRKLDRKALPPPKLDRELSPEAEALTPTERALCDLVSEVLDGARIHRDDPFAVAGLHSLSLARLVSRIESSFSVRPKYSEVFTASTVRGLAALLDGKLAEARTEGEKSPAGSEASTIPLSFAQERVWFLERLHRDCGAYRFQAIFHFRGRLDVEALRRSLQHLVSRHEILRTSFPVVEGRACQVVHEFEPFEVPLEPLSSPADLDSRVAEELSIPFDTAQRPLVRWRIFRLGEEDHRLLHQEHHFLHDGWSYGVFLDELSACYAAFSRGVEPDLPPPSLQYREYASRERALFESGALDRELEYWKERLSSAPPPPSLPSDRPRPAKPSFRGGQIRRVLDERTYSRLLAASAREGVTPFTWLHTVFQLFLHRYTGATDLVVGSGFANRVSPESERMLGMVINTVAIRGDLSGAPSFRELLARTGRALLEAADHQSVPFDAVVQAIAPERAAAPGQVLFNTFFDSYDRPYPVLRAPGLEVSREDGIGNGQVKFDLVALVVPREARENRVVSADLLWEYASDLFDRETAKRMLSHFESLLEASLESPETAIDRLPLGSKEERALALAMGAPSSSSYPRDRSISELFEEQAAERPGSIAVSAMDASLSYDELNRRANRLARRFRSEGIGPGSVVGIEMERGLEVVVSLLAILKAGAAYLPLEPDLPRDRRDRMLADAGVRTVLDAIPPDLPSETANLEPVPGGDALAYVMYTSGSTGTPKGVAIPHRGVVRLVKGADYVALGPEERVLHLAPLSFDASNFEIWGALLNGGTLVVFPPRKPTLQELGRFLEESHVTTLWLTASLFHQMIDFELDRLSRVKQILAGGDVLSPSHVKRLLARLPEGARVVNGYGPTENTTFTCCHVMTRSSDVGASVPIGRPISGTRVHLLDANLEPVPIGVPGEIYACGDGVALGYLGRPDLTSERFVRDREGLLFHRTGDFARFRADGLLEFLGRRDHQVKIRGYRVELGEVEAALRGHPEVRDAAAVRAEEDSLVAYVVLRDGSDPDLRAFLMDRLPAYMVPSTVVAMDALPLTAAGKIDRAKLPRPGASMTSPSVPPRTAAERRVAEIWREVLGVPDLSVTDHFFALGGHSLLATRIVNRMERAFGVAVPLSAFFEAGTVAAMAERLERLERMPPDPRPELGEL